MLNGLIKRIDPNDPVLAKISITHARDVETIDSISVDALEMTHPEMAEMPENDRQEMKKVLGEDKFCILIAKTDKNTIVLTFGASKALLSEAIKAVKAKTPLLSAKQMAQFTKYMPAKTNSLCALNVGNFLHVAKNIQQIMEPENQNSPFKINFKTTEPLVLASGYTGKSTHLLLFVPNKLIQEIVQIGIMMQMGIGGPSGANSE